MCLLAVAPLAVSGCGSPRSAHGETPTSFKASPKNGPKVPEVKTKKKNSGYTPLPSWAKRQGMKLEDRQKVTDIGPAARQGFHLADLSPDGRVASFVWTRWPRTNIGIVDLATGEPVVILDMGRRTIEPPGPKKTKRGWDRTIDLVTGDPLFSPDGNRILFQDGHNLRVMELAEATTSIVAHTKNRYETGYRWLNDGRIAYLNKFRRIAKRWIGHPAHPIGFAISDPAGFDRWSIDPSGRSLLMWNGCGTTLIDLETRTRRTLDDAFVAERGSWSPNGNRFFLKSGSVYDYIPYRRHCPHVEGGWRGRSLDKLYRRDGTSITRGKSSVFGESISGGHGHSTSWSKDGRFLLATYQWTGTCVMAYRELHAADMEKRRRDRLLNLRVQGDALGGRDGLVVFSRYNTLLESVCDQKVNNDDDSSAIYTGHLTRA
jgi:hypothetical protein